MLHSAEAPPWPLFEHGKKGLLDEVPSDQGDLSDTIGHGAQPTPGSSAARESDHRKSTWLDCGDQAALCNLFP